VVYRASAHDERQEVAKSIDQVVSKWAANAGAAQTAYTDGITNTTVDPTALAAANQAGYLAGVQGSVNLWRSNLLKAGKAKWQSKSLAKAGNFGTGVAAAKDDYQAAMSTWLPRIQAAGAAAKAMPGGTIDQRIARSAYVARTLYNAKRGL
jgi:hypothetical protein